MTSINNFVLKNFILDKIGNSLNLQEARDLDIEDAYQEAYAELGTDEIEIEDILDNDELYEQFATLYVTETEEEEAIDKEKEEEERNKVQGKNEAGV